MCLPKSQVIRNQAHCRSFSWIMMIFFFHPSLQTYSFHLFYISITIKLVDLDKQMMRELAQIRKLEDHGPLQILVRWCCQIVLVHKMFSMYAACVNIFEFKIVAFLCAIQCLISCLETSLLLTTRRTLLPMSSLCTCFALFGTSRYWQHSHAWNG